MADGGCDGRAGNGVLELEAMRKDTFSWHPCQVSLRPKAFGLIVQYEDTNLEEVISSKDGVLASVRVRSTPLQGDDCSSLQQGDIVLATHNSQVRGLFCDAQVKEVIHVRHSKRIHCRCSFKIHWLHRSLEEKTLTVPASAIKILSTKSIMLHSIIAAFFGMVDSLTNELKTPPLAASVHGMNLEVDLSMLLGNQIEKMDTLADAPDKKVSDSIAFKLKVDLKRQTQATAVDLPLKNPSVNIPILNGLKGSNSSKNKEFLEKKVKDDATDPILSNQELLMTSRSPLSPLAARAALAMLRSNLPEGAAARSNVETGDIASSAAALSKLSATSGGKSPTNIATRLFPASDSPRVEFSNVSSRAQANGRMQKKRKTEEPSEKKVARSKFSNGIQESNIGETPTMSSNKAPRVTRSTIEEEKVVRKDALADSEKGDFSEASEGHSSSRRITRSAAAAKQGVVEKKTNAQHRLENQANITSESTKLRNVPRKHRRSQAENTTNPPIAALGSKDNGDADTQYRTGGIRNKTPPSSETPVSHRPRTRSQK